MSRHYTKIISNINPLGYNCVFFARSKVRMIPFGLFTFEDKMRIKNAKYPHKGDVAIIKTNQKWGHIAVVTYIGKKHITIQEGNWKIGKITERHAAPVNLNIKGYFHPKST